MAHILVADDYPPLRRLVELALTSAGHHVLSVPDGEAAVDAARGGIPLELLIVDHRLPGMNGLATAMAVRRIRHGLPCLIVSGDEGIRDQSGRLLLVGIGVVRKPFSVPELLGAVDASLDSSYRLLGRSLRRSAEQRAQGLR